MSKNKKLPSNSYHDAVVIINGKRYEIFNSSFGMELSLNKVAGWSFWHLWEGKQQKIGGEYEYTAFEIELNGVSVFRNKEARKLNKKKTIQAQQKYLEKLKKKATKHDD